MFNCPLSSANMQAMLPRLRGTSLPCGKKDLERTENTGDLINLHRPPLHNIILCRPCRQHKASIASRSGVLQDKPFMPFEKRFGYMDTLLHCRCLHSYEHSFGFVCYHSFFYILCLMKQKSGAYKRLAFSCLYGQDSLAPKPL